MTILHKENTIKPTFYTLPQAMYDLDAIKIVLAEENNSILFKTLKSDMLNMEKIIVSHSIVYVESGRVEVQTYDYKKFTITDGEMLFMPRDSYLISDYIKKEEDMRVFIFFFDFNISSEFLSCVNSKAVSTDETILKIDVTQNLSHYIAALKNVDYKNKRNAHLLKSKMFELLHLVSESNKEFISILRSQESDKTDIETYMLKHYDKELSVNDWATLSGQSLSTFNRKFKKVYNLSPKKWMLKQNMKLAKEALSKGISVSECSSMFSYQNTSNFIKAYKEVYNITPKQDTLT
ncbi:MAG: helix-turn-helix domain-containing protein [Campylobacterota bacterium]|nr:helix-turn-helix domain-containing protein [Campylobacterota bacterium]